MVTYRYDAWGNHKVYDSSNSENTISSFVGNINPIRYKEYYYDVETGWYYLKSRYYSPLLSKFINMDSTQYLEPGSIEGINLFSYCGNNPVMKLDDSGNLLKWQKWVIGGLFIVAAVALTKATAVVGTLFAGAILGAASGALVNAGTQIITKDFDDFSLTELGKSALSGAIAGALAGGLFGGIKYGLSAGKIARGVSGLKNAESNLTNAFSPLINIKSLAKMPFSNINIFRSIGQAASNFNNAYSAYVFAKATYTAVNIAESTTYFLLENLTSELLGLVL